MATIRDSFDAMHMSNSRAYEVQRTNHFEVHIVNVGEGDDIILSVQSSPLPTIGVDPIELPYGNTDVKVAGKLTLDDIDLEVKDFVGADIEYQIDEWQQQVFNVETGQLGYAADYKRTAYQYQYSPGTAGPDITRTWVLEGVFPSSVSYGDMSYDGGDSKMISMTLSVDKAYRQDRNV